MMRRGVRTSVEPPSHTRFRQCCTPARRRHTIRTPHAEERRSIEVGRNEPHPPRVARPRHHVPGRQYEPVSDERSSSAVSLVVENPPHEAPRPGVIIEGVPSAVVDPKRLRPRAVEPAQPPRGLVHTQIREWQCIDPLGPVGLEGDVFGDLVEELRCRMTLHGAAQLRTPGFGVHGDVHATALSVVDGTNIDSGFFFDSMNRELRASASNCGETDPVPSTARPDYGTRAGDWALLDHR